MEHEAAGKMQAYKKEISAWWTADCSFYDNYPEHGLTRREEELWEKFLKQEIGENPKTILDVGCGTGSIALILSALGHDVSGIDLSEGMLSVCEKKAAFRGLPIQIQIGDAEALPFPDHSFDIITSRWVLWTLLRPEVAMSEWKRVLKPGGKILAFDVKTHTSGNGTIPDKIRQYVSKSLISLQDGRKLNSYTYKKEIHDALPLAYHLPDSFDRQVRLFQDAGLTGVITKPVEPLAVMPGEKLEKPWRYRFGWKGYGDWHCISGYKDETCIQSGMINPDGPH
ncbi:MAG TPA: methyltransferase domain-containing protein [Methanospirillum sp.]|nr:methyltransferase domain-containing protein [Methanospirillum sp.]